MPSVYCFIDGKNVAKIIGFEELGMKDDFPTLNLLRRLVKEKMITPLNKSEKGQMAISMKSKKQIKDEDSDYSC